MKRTYNIEDKEPTESNFKIPSEKEHLFQVVDVNPHKSPSGYEDENIQVVKLEVVGGEEKGLSILNRVNLNDQENAFYYSRLFLKAIGEPYKGQFSVNVDNWVGKQFYATVKHSKSKDGTKTYANIGEYNFNKVVDNSNVSRETSNPGGVNDPKSIAWDE